MAQTWGIITVLDMPHLKINSGSRFSLIRERKIKIKKPVLVCLTAFLALFSISRVAAAQSASNCPSDFSEITGEKTVNLTNNSPQPETLVVNLMSASWDATVEQWVGGKTYTLELPAESGKRASGQLSYVGCGKGHSYAVVFQISITGAKNRLYQMTGNDPYASGQEGNLNCGINVVSTKFNEYSSSFSNIGCPMDMPLTPKLATASSTMVENGTAGVYFPAHAMNPDKAAWMSSLDTGKPQWLQYDYGAGLKVKVSAVRAYLANGRSGDPTFQGSKDGATWVTLGSWHDSKFTSNGAPWPGYGSYADLFPASTEGYRYIRIYSTSTTYLFYSWLQFYGVVVQ